jgi:hypothetical protein
MYYHEVPLISSFSDGVREASPAEYVQVSTRRTTRIYRI